ncbi:MAG: NAD(+) synthase [Dehalococcoidales bacterium]|nr:NAD(+) synthase [Dehalococcoidales bacterium]
MEFHKDVLRLDCEHETDRMCAFIQQQAALVKRDGVVIGLSGGVDSAVASSLCVKALGKTRVLGLILPEKESSPVSQEYALKQARQCGMDTVIEDITLALEGVGAYQRRDKAIREIFPEYNDRYKSKLVLPPDLLTKDTFNFFSLKIKDEAGNIRTFRLNNKSSREILAAANTKQITRMMYLNYYAEKYNYIVCGTTNRSEYIQGFFVKYGDGGVDIEPINHLYKTQVYQVADYIGVIPEIIKRPPSPDTFTFEVTDEEMHFRLPYDILDMFLFAWENNCPAAKVSAVMNITEDQVARVFRDITSKYKATGYLRLPPQNLLNAL